MNNMQNIMKYVIGSVIVIMAVFAIDSHTVKAGIDPLDFLDPGCVVGLRDCVSSSKKNVRVQNVYTYPTPNYNYNNNYNYNQTRPLQVSCYVSPGTIQTGGVVQWIASASGGTGSYTYSWSGSDGLSGSSANVSRSYSSTGFKTGSVTVSSGGQSQSKDCGSVNVYDNSAPSQPSNTSNNYYYNSYPQNLSYYYPYNYNYYPYNYNYSYYNNTPLYASCYPDATYTTTGTVVRWYANVSGGNGYYTYSWSGTDGLYGYYQNTNITYYTPGTKNAYVTVSSNGQSVYAYCNAVNVSGVYSYPYTNTYVNYPTGYYYNNQNTLDIGCYADPSKIGINQPATWVAEVTGGIGPYTYSWTGTDGLTGNQASVIKYYSSSGYKTAIVSIRSADGKTGTRTCSAGLTVGSTGVAKTPKAPVVQVVKETPVQPDISKNQNQMSNVGFSLGNIPWGWVAFLIILVLFSTVMYLLFNRYKV
jgi:hypothetical protein